MSRQTASPTVVTAESAVLTPQTAVDAVPTYQAPAAAGRLLSAAIAGADPVGGSTLRHILLQCGLVNEIREWSSAKSANVRNAQDVPDVVFVDLNGSLESELGFAQQLMKLRPSAHIVACSARKEASPEFLLQAMRSGVRDFLQKPYDRIEVTEMLARIAAERAQEAQPVASGKLFVVLGTKGGVGTSTVAINLAVQLAQNSQKKTVLLDFSRPMGDVAAVLDLRPRFQLRDALENSKRLDQTMFCDLLAAHKSGLQVLAGAAQPEDWQVAPFAAMERVVEVAQQSFDFVVVDCGAFYAPEWQEVFKAAEVLLVSEADLPGLSKLTRHLRALGRLNVMSDQVRLIINRWHRHDEEALKKVEEEMHIPVFARVPNNFKQVTEATVRGDSLKGNGDPLSEEFRKMSAELSGQKAAARRKKSRLLQLFSF